MTPAQRLTAALDNLAILGKGTAGGVVDALAAAGYRGHPEQPSDPGLCPVTRWLQHTLGVPNDALGVVTLYVGVRSATALGPRSPDNPERRPRWTVKLPRCVRDALRDIDTRRPLLRSRVG